MLFFALQAARSLFNFSSLFPIRVASGGLPESPLWYFGGGDRYNPNKCKDFYEPRFFEGNTSLNSSIRCKGVRHPATKSQRTAVVIHGFRCVQIVIRGIQM